MVRHLAAILALSLPQIAASTAEPVNLVTWFQVVSDYMKDENAAATKYDGKRLAMKGFLIRMGDDPDTTYFGVVQSDGQKFDTKFNLADQPPLAKKFPDGIMKAFKPSEELVFECLNEGYIPEAMTIKLTNCRLVE